MKVHSIALVDVKDVSEVERLLEALATEDISMSGSTITANHRTTRFALEPVRIAAERAGEFAPVSITKLNVRSGEFDWEYDRNLPDGMVVIRGK